MKPKRIKSPFFCPGPWFGPEHRHQHQDTHPSGLPRPPDLSRHVLPRLRQQGLLIRLPVPTWGGGPVNGEMAMGGGLLTYTQTRKPQTAYPYLPVIPPCSGETEASDPRPDGHPLLRFRRIASWVQDSSCGRWGWIVKLTIDQHIQTQSNSS